MKAVVGILFVAWLMLGGLACEQAADLTPRLESVSPSAWVSGRDGYVIFKGRFASALSWDREGPQASGTHQVFFGGQASTEVHLLGPEHLSARLPEGGLEAGSVDVELWGPDGSSARLPGALCVVDGAPTELLAGCLLEDIPGLCSASLDEEPSVFRFVLPGALASVFAQPSLYQALGMAAGYDLSPDGRWVAYLTLQYVEGEVFHLDLRFGAFDDVASHEQVEVEDYVVGQANLPLSFPRISPDGHRLLYIQGNSRLMSHAIDPQSGSLGPAELVFDAVEDEPETLLMWLDIDPSSRLALVTRVVPVEQECWEETYGTKRAELLLVDLREGKLLQRLRPDNPCRSDGPGVFHPAGDRLVFVSNREGRLVVSPFGEMMPSNSVFVRGLAAQAPVENLVRFQTALFLGPPVVRQDGMRVALAGTLSDLSGYGWDMLLLNVESGRLQRLRNESSPGCQPAIGSVCVVDEVFGEDCCDANGDNCCDPVTGLNCPTWDLGAAFHPDGQSLVYNGTAYAWSCSDASAWKRAEAPGIKLFAAERLEGTSLWFVGDLTPSPDLMNAWLTSPRFVERPACAP